MSSVKVSTQSHQMTICLDRPEKRNAFDRSMIAQLTEAFHQASTDGSVRAVLLKGAGKSFCAGADLGWMKSMVEYSVEENRADSIELRSMFVALEKIPCPVIGQVHGHVMGGALGLLAVCDLAVAEKNTAFCFSEVKLGLSPAVISEFVARKVPRSFLQRYFLTGEVFGAREAREMGLVHALGSEDDIQDQTTAWLEKIVANGPKALVATKALLQKIYSSDSDFGSYTVDLISKLRVGAEGQEGLGAFFEKRHAKWKGQSYASD